MALGRANDLIGEARRMTLRCCVWSRLMAAGRNGTASTEEEKEKLGKQEAIIFCMPCPNCHADGEAVNCVTDIPYFKVGGAEGPRVRQAVVIDHAPSGAWHMRALWLRAERPGLYESSVFCV